MTKMRLSGLLTVIAGSALLTCMAGEVVGQSRVGRADLAVGDDGSITTPPFRLPFSSFASPEAAAEFRTRLTTPADPEVLKGGIQAVRKMADAYVEPMLAKHRTLYPFTSKKAVVGGVPVEIFLPARGISPGNRDRVLINLHGGGFTVGGGGPVGAVESIPIAHAAGMKVVSVDYRMAPEYRFPAASQDLEVVYRDLLKTYRPANIGIYGCSAGGMLAGESIGWFQKHGLPLPGAIGVFCASLHTFDEGDSAQLWTRMGSILPMVPPAKPRSTFEGARTYFENVSTNDPLAVPAASKALLRGFPPVLFVTGSRSPEMSAAAQSHLELRDLGKDSELLIFDGMDHSFIKNPNFPEARRAYELVGRFFNAKLGHRSNGK